MERFDFMKSNGRDFLVCAPRNLTLEVIQSKDKPAEEKECLMGYGIFKDKRKGGRSPFDHDITVVFIVHNPDEIKYELFLTQNLIENAIKLWAKESAKMPFDIIEYSRAFQKNISIPYRPTRH